MKSAVETLSPTRVRISIEVDFTEMAPHIKTAYQAISSKIVIPGFRKGKIPPAMIDQRVGRPTVLDEAINSALPDFYTKAARENEVLVVGRPTVDITELKDNEHIKFTVEVDVRPEISLPDFSTITLNVDDLLITDKDVAEQIDGLRARFGTLTTVEKSASKGDFVSIDLTARANGVDLEGGDAKGVSYEVGSNAMIDGLDGALEGMSVAETKKFTAQLVGMAAGESGEVEVTLQAVKTRELPELNDDFAAMASEFDTVDELRKDLQERLTRVKKMEQGAQARDLLVKQLLETIDIPVPEGLVADEVKDHLEKESRLEDDAHRSEVTAEIRSSVATDFLLDAIVKAEAVQVSEAEFTEYLIRASSRYQMSPEQFAEQLAKAGQISSLVAEVARTKALALVLERAKVVDASGRIVDLSTLTPKPVAVEPVALPAE